MADQLEMLQTALTQGLRGITDAARVRLQVAERENDRQFALAREREARNYAEKLAERRRQQAKDDAAEERMRSMRNQLSALMPMGTPINANMTEEQLSQEIAKRTRERQLQYGAEDRKVLLDAEIQRASTLAEAKLREEGRQLGIDQSDTLSVPELRIKVAEASTNERIKMDKAAFDARVDAAKNDPRYSALRSRLGALQYERASLIAQSTMPEPVFDPMMTGQDSLEIYAAMADRPAVMAAFSKLPDAKTRLDALRNGDMQTAVAGLKPVDAESIRMSIETEQTGLDQALRSGKYGQFTAAKMAYIERLRRLPQMLGEVDRQISNLYQIGSKEGVYYGLALQFEDPADLAKETFIGPPSNLQTMPGVGSTGRSNAGGMPLPNPDQIPTEYNYPTMKEHPQYIRGLSDVVDKIASDPVLGSAPRRISRYMVDQMNVPRDLWRNAKTLWTGGVPQSSQRPNPLDPLIAAMELRYVPNRLIQMGADAMSTPTPLGADNPMVSTNSPAVIGNE